MPTKLSQLPRAGTLSGDEIVPIVQGTRTSQTTARRIADLNPARVESVAGKTGAVTLTKSDVGLGNVDNTSDLDKPVSTATQARFDALPVFASAAENAAGAVEGKMVDPLGIREAFNATGNAPVFACRAWVNFNGTGTVAIRASGNVSSITDNGTGSYTVNLTTEMPDDKFAAVPSTEGGDRTVTSGISSTSAVLIRTSQASVPTPSDQSQVTLAIFR